MTATRAQRLTVPPPDRAFVLIHLTITLIPAPQTNLLVGGLAVRLYHKEAEGAMSSSLKPSQSGSAEDASAITIDDDAHGMLSSDTIWQFERAERSSGAPLHNGHLIHWDHVIRLRHAATGMILAVTEPVAEADASTPARLGNTLGTPRGGLQKSSTAKSSLRSMASGPAVSYGPDVAVGLTSEYEPSMTLFELVPQYPHDGPVHHRHPPPCYLPPAPRLCTLLLGDVCTTRLACLPPPLALRFAHTWSVDRLAWTSTSGFATFTQAVGSTRAHQPIRMGHRQSHRVG